MEAPAQPLRVLIVGGGIAGPVCAFSLARLSALRPQDVAITIVERMPNLRTWGQAVDIRGAARTVVRRMGLEDAIREVTTREEGFSLVDGKGARKAGFPAGGGHGDGNGGFTAEIEILRGDLSRVFYEATEGLCEYVFGDYVTALEETEKGVKVSFAESKQTREFDLVIAADGQGSKTRGLVFASAEGTMVQSLGMWTSYFTIPRESHDGTWSKWYNAPGSRCIFQRPNISARGVTGVYLSIMPKEGSEVEAELKDYRKLDVEGQKKLYRKLFEDAGWEAERFLEGMDKAEDFYMQSIVQVRMEKWHKGRVVVLGDAGYCPSPVSGMGTSLAIVGGYVLAGEIGRAFTMKGSSTLLEKCTAAFEAYEKKMRPYVAKAQELPPGAPKIANPETAWGIWLLYGIIEFAAKSGLATLIGWLVADEKAERIDIKGGYGKVDDELGE